MTNKEIWDIALQQSAYDFSCNAEDFLSSENKIFISKPNEKARKYLSLPFECDMVSYGNNIVAQTNGILVETVEKYLAKYPIEHCKTVPLCRWAEKRSYRKRI